MNEHEVDPREKTILNAPGKLDNLQEDFRTREIYIPL